jgi:presenilin-like A22 family membrane protease
MKPNLKIIAVIISMFLLTQFLGLYVVNHYSSTKIIDGEKINVTAPNLPLGLDTPEIEKQSDFWTYFPVIIIAFAIAIAVLFLLSKFKIEFFLRGWFFVVVVIALTIFFNTFLDNFNYSTIISLLVALPLAFLKIYKRNILVHNITELMIYPGIAVIFVPLLNIYTILVLLVIISIYDAWAVWHSGIMQKMAKFQINKLKVFGGFLIPFISKKMRAKIKKLKKSKSKNKKSIKVHVAALGGGDICWTMIPAGIALKTFGFVTIGSVLVPLASIFVILGATIALTLLQIFSKKDKFYPAMPFITAGILLGLGISWLIL